jgi:hypothetical protein
VSVDPFRLEAKVAMFGVVAVHWMLAVAIPAFIFGHIQLPPQEDWAAVLWFAAIVGYCIYSGYRAWKREWRSRFILRAVVPAVLFVLSFACFAFLAWA